MTVSVPAPASPPPNPGHVTGAGWPALVAALAAGWMLSRVVVGLDFADEMQYYCEIASLVRTNQLFHDDLFVQQLGHLFVYPFFKLHAAVAPDQAYLLVFGRLLLVAAYAATGVLFWRVSGRIGGFSRPARLAALAVLLAWIPFQLFAFSYNTLGYLLGVAIVGVWLLPDANTRGRAATLAALLTLLTYSYPPAGLVVLAALAIDAGIRHGLAAAVRLAGYTLAGGLLVLGGCFLLQGPSFFDRLLLSLRFSGLYSVGYTFRYADHLGGFLLLLLAGGLFWQRTHAGEAFRLPALIRAQLSRPLVRVLLAVVIATCVFFGVRWREGYFGTAAALVALFLLVIIVDLRGPEHDADPVRASRKRLLVGGVLAGCVGVMVLGVTLPTGYFGITAFMLLLIALGFGPAVRDPRPGDIALLGTALGVVYSLSSGNGLHNFGIGAAAVLPYLGLHAAKRLEQLAVATSRSRLLALAPTLLAGAVLVNGVLNPYREPASISEMEPVRGVPAFAGLWTSPTKVEALKYVRQLSDRPELAGKRLLVAGPHPWIYFATPARPTTPMAFMHFSGGPAADRLIAEQLFTHGEPDAILITNLVPDPIHARIEEWMKGGFTAEKIVLPRDFPIHYWVVVRSAIRGELVLLQRKPPP